MYLYAVRFWDNGIPSNDVMSINPMQKYKIDLGAEDSQVQPDLGHTFHSPFVFLDYENPLFTPLPPIHSSPPSH